MLVDTHCHLADPAFDADREAVVGRMVEAGVARAMVIESVTAQLEATLDWAARHPGLVVATGCHPHDASRWDAALATWLQDAWRHPLVRAAGEMGLDYHYDFSPREQQRAAFAEQLALATAAGLPIVIHAREADDDIVAILREQPAATVILHSFSSGAVLRDAGLAAGWYFSFSGMVTFRSWTDQDTMRAVPDDRLLIETDAPYLAPVPHRGKRNEPSFVPGVARTLAEVRGTTYDSIAAMTTSNALRLFWSEEEGDR
jgi:TatD DNase family protein